MNNVDDVDDDDYDYDEYLYIWWLCDIEYTFDCILLFV